jgi:hypothetical protein
MRLGIDRDGRDKDWHDCRAYLDNEPGNHCVAERGAINLPLFQLTEERVHLSPRRLRSIGYRRHHVELGIDYAKFHSRSHDTVIRVYDGAGNLIAAHEHKGDFREW